MPATLDVRRYVDALDAAAAQLARSAADAGLDSPVPTCPEWRVRDLLIHQGMVHRWAADNLRGHGYGRHEQWLAEGSASADPLGWFEAGAGDLAQAIRTAADDIDAIVFLHDAPPPRLFWARRQAHETTIHGVDAQSAQLGRPPTAAEVSISPELAADGIDELLTGFLPRRKTKLHSVEPYTVVVHATDVPRDWHITVSESPPVTAHGTVSAPDLNMVGSAVELYLGLWNRGDIVRIEGRTEILDQWRTDVKVLW